MILVTQNKDVYEIRFPYDVAIIEHVKNVPGRMWNPQGKFWYIPLARLGFLISQFKGTPYERQLQIQSQEDINVNASLDTPQAIPDIDISEYGAMTSIRNHPIRTWGVFVVAHNLHAVNIHLYHHPMVSYHDGEWRLTRYHKPDNTANYLPHIP